MMKRLGKLELKFNTLQSKPFEIPYEKEELLNIVVCRVDDLEAELIATKKVGCYNFFFPIFIFLKNCSHDHMCISITSRYFHGLFFRIFVCYR